MISDFELTYIVLMVDQNVKESSISWNNVVINTEDMNISDLSLFG